MPGCEVFQTVPGIGFLLLARNRTKKNNAGAGAMPPRNHQTDENFEAICDYLISTNANWNSQDKDVESIKGDLCVALGLSDDRVRRYIKALKSKSDGRLSETLVINPYQTRFRHQFRVGFKVDLVKLHADAPDGREPFEWLIETVIKGTCDNKKLSQSLLIFEGVVLHGVASDVEFTLFSANGISDVLHWISNELMQEKYLSVLTSATTASVSYSHRWRGYAGQTPKPFPKLEPE
jgi:hypothetical protein